MQKGTYEFQELTIKTMKTVEIIARLLYQATLLKHDEPKNLASECKYESKKSKKLRLYRKCRCALPELTPVV